jgi:hypothetical protein
MAKGTVDWQWGTCIVNDFVLGNRTKLTNPSPDFDAYANPANFPNIDHYTYSDCSSFTSTPANGIHFIDGNCTLSGLSSFTLNGSLIVRGQLTVQSMTGSFSINADENIIVDNTDSECSFVGSWTTSTSESGYYGSNYRESLAGVGNDIVTWNPDIPQSGVYEVFARLTDSSSSNRAFNAKYSINYSAGSKEISINQHSNGGAWISLGRYYFDIGTSGSVVLSDDADNVVLADAMKFEYQFDYPAIVTEHDLNFTSTGNAFNDAIINGLMYSGRDINFSAVDYRSFQTSAMVAARDVTMVNVRNLEIDYDPDIEAPYFTGGTVTIKSWKGHAD